MSPISSQQSQTANTQRIGELSIGATMVASASIPILLVDDYQTMVRIVRNLLKQIGYENVDDAADGGAALAKMREKTYRLVISDWNMQPMSGFEFLKQVRADETLKQTAFVMITAESSVQLVMNAKKAGVDSYLIKPFNDQTLKDKIAEALAARP